MAESLRSPIRLAISETRMQLRLLRRNPVSVLFTVALPLFLLPLLDALQGDVFVELPAAPASGDRFAPWMQYATPTIAAFAVVTACFANLAIRTSVARESGVLKQVRGTPLPPASHLAGRILSNAIVALLVAGVTLSAGAILYDVEVPIRSLPTVAALVVLGAIVFSALGLATTTIVPNSDAAPAVVYALLLPLAFLSNVFYPPELAPEWMARTAEALPLGPFVTAMVGAVTPTTQGTGVLFGEVAAMVGWGLFGLSVALVAFSWVPNRERTRGSTARLNTPIRRLAIPLGMAAALAGVLVPEERPVEEYRVGSTAQLERRGQLTTEIGVSTDNVSAPSNVVLTQSFPGFPGGLPGLFPVQVSVLDRGDGPEAFGFPTCGIEAVSDVDAEWLGAVSPNRTGGAFVQPCTGAVYEADFSCAAGPCAGPLLMPTVVEGDRISVRAEGTLVSDPGSDGRAPPINPKTFAGQLIAGEQGDVVDVSFDLVSDDAGIALVDDETGWVIRFVSASPWLGTITGFDVLGPPDSSQVVASLFTNEPLGYESVPVDSERFVQEFGTRFTTTVPSEGERLVTFRPTDDDPASERGFVRLSTTGPLLEWATVVMDFQIDGFQRVQLDLERTP